MQNKNSKKHSNKYSKIFIILLASGEFLLYSDAS